MLSLLLIDLAVLSKLLMLMLLRIVVSFKLELYPVVEDVLSSRLLLFLLSLMSFNLLTSFDVVVERRFFEADAGGIDVSIGSPSPSPLLLPSRCGIAMFLIFSSCFRSEMEETRVKLGEILEA